MELKQIAAYSLLEYSQALAQALAEGFSISEKMENCPSMLAHLFCATLVKGEEEIDQSEQIENLEAGYEMPKVRTAKKPKSMM